MQQLGTSLDQRWEHSYILARTEWRSSACSAAPKPVYVEAYGFSRNWCQALDPVPEGHTGFRCLTLSQKNPGNSKLDEVRGRSDSLEPEKELVEAFTNADWAGDKSSPARRRHSVSSALIFVDNRLVTSRSLTQKSIALSSCESEYLSAGGWCRVPLRGTSLEISDQKRCGGQNCFKFF